MVQNDIIHLSIVQKNSNGYIIYSYNPFYLQIDKRALKSGTEIFPNKLKNGNGYNIKLGVISTDIYSSITKNDRGNIIDVTGSKILLNLLI